MQMTIVRNEEREKVYRKHNKRNMFHVTNILLHPSIIPAMMYFIRRHRYAEL